MIRICFVIGRMEVGGAQRQLITLLQGLDKTLFDITLITLFPAGRLDCELAEVPGIERITLDTAERWHLFRRILRLARAIRKRRPHVVHGYMATSNILVALLKPFLPGTRIVWGIRSAHDQFDPGDGNESLTFRLQNHLSRSADLTISNSHAGRETCIRHEFSSDKVIVIPNGIDTARFKPNGLARQRIRAEWGIEPHEILIGLVARLHPVKDHPTFIEAAAVLAIERPDVRFVCIGDGDAVYTRQLKSLAQSAGLGDRLVWAGNRSDMESVYVAFDLCASTSLSEAFPNVVLEAMACGVPCVVTDVGDCASLVGDAGIVVAPGSSEAVANGWRQCLRGEFRDMGLRARARVVAGYGTDRLVERTTRAIQAIIHARRSKLS